VTTIGFAGGDGGAMASSGLLEHCLVCHDLDPSHPECHVAAYHIAWDLVHTLLARSRLRVEERQCRHEICR